MASPEAPAPKLAELHLHLYGSIDAADYLDHLTRAGEVDYGRYEDAFEEAYGQRPDARALVERHRAGDPSAAAEFEQLFVFGDEDAGNFKRFQAKFNLLMAGSVAPRLHAGTAPIEALRDEVVFFVDRILDGQRRAGIGYAEQRVLMGPRVSPETVAMLYCELLDHYAEAPGITARLAPSLPRDDPWPQWEVVKRLLEGPHGASLTAIDFCFIEEGHPPKAKAELFEDVHAWNDRHPERAVAILYHVGESFTDKSLESAIRWVVEAAELGVHRLGHAIALGVDPEAYGPHTRDEVVCERLDQIEYDLTHARALRAAGVTVDEQALARERDALREQAPSDTVTITYDAARLDEVRRRQEHAMARVRHTGAVVEVCPTSNRRIGAIDDPAHHPVRRFVEHGLKVVVATDDPGIFGVTLEEELGFVARALGHTEGAREELIAASWRYRSERLSGREGPAGRGG